MKQQVLQAVRLTIITVVFFAVLYPCVVWAIAQFSPGNGKGETIEYDGKKFYSHIGQSFTDDMYFQSRPSAVGYNAARSAGSNKGPSNKEYLAEVQARIDAFLVHNPGINRSEIPVDLVTAGGSGLDPDISVQAANVQVKRIARIRNLPERELYSLIEEQTEKPFLGVLGPKKINVLKLNIALNQMHP